jgi:hypothetical protein
MFLLVLISDVNNSKNPSCCLVFKNLGKNLAKTRNFGFLRNDCEYGWGRRRKPTKNQGEIQGKPSVLVGFLDQKRTVQLHTPYRQWF